MGEKIIMDIIEMTRELGVKLQEDERYKKYWETKTKMDLDEPLQNIIGEFNLKKVSINSEMSKPDKDNEKLNKLNTELQDLYNKIMDNENMKIFSVAKGELDALLSHVTSILMMSANGDDPATAGDSSCGGDCGGCAGCH